MASVYAFPWVNQEILLFHGTHAASALAIQKSISVSIGRQDTDFGRGFYMTTSYEQAERWSIIRAAEAGDGPTVVQLRLPREALADLDALVFVRGDHDADDYWSFVIHCRKKAADHQRPGPRKSYDVVYGPVSRKWRQRQSFLWRDQVSFHTTAAEKMLNSIGTTSVINL